MNIGCLIARRLPLRTERRSATVIVLQSGRDVASHNATQDQFAAPLSPDSASSTQVLSPTEEDTLAAYACMQRAYESLGLAFTAFPVDTVA